MATRAAPPYSAALLGGAAAGLSVDLMFYPLDTLKTRLQSPQGFVAAGAFKGVYRGIGSVAVGSAPGGELACEGEWSCERESVAGEMRHAILVTGRASAGQRSAAFFVTYEGLKPVLAPHIGSGASLHMCSASLAEIAACLIRVPTEVVKSRQQTAAYGAKASSLSALRAVLGESGVRGLYRGYAGTVGREIPFTCIQFPLYEALKHRIARSPTFGHDPNVAAAASLAGASAQLPTWQAGLAGSVAGAIAACTTTPLDVVKTRIMLERRSPGTSARADGVNARILPTLLHIARHEGLGALWSGAIPRTLWIGLGGFVFLGTFEAVLKAVEAVPVEVP